MLGFNNKKGVSIIVGYVLLIVFAVIMGAIVYSGLRTYVPTETLQCPDGVSLFVQDSNYCGSQLNLTIRNNGRFNVAGYYILAANSPSQELETIDISPYLNEAFEGKDFRNTIMFLSLENNSFNPGNKTTNVFDIPAKVGTISSLQLVPARFQEQDNRERFARCANVKIIEKNFNCLEPLPECVPAADPTLTGVCGTRICGPATNGTCGNVNCGACPTGLSCDAAGDLCYDQSACTPASDPTLFGVCGTKQCGIATNGTCGQASCGECNTGYECNTGFQCVLSCGDGNLDVGETCDDGNTANSDGCSSTCATELGYTCSGTPSSCIFDQGSACSNNCISSGFSHGGSCTTPTSCISPNTMPFSGNAYCGAGQGRCCCLP